MDSLDSALVPASIISFPVTPIAITEQFSVEQFSKGWPTEEVLQLLQEAKNSFGRQFVYNLSNEDPSEGSVLEIIGPSVEASSEIWEQHNLLSLAAHLSGCRRVQIYHEVDHWTDYLPDYDWAVNAILSSQEYSEWYNNKLNQKDPE